MSRLLTLLTVLSMSIASALFAAEPGAVPEKTKPVIKDDPNLPRVLIIGDSISIGYFPEVAALLKEKANVHHNEGNGGPTSHGVEQIDKWLADGKWDVIHFNFGLHDLKTSTGGKDDKPYPDGYQVTPAQYEKNLREIVAKMKKTNAKLIWASTTPVPEGKQNPGRTKGDEVTYNSVARKVMEENHIAIDDLYALVLPQVDQIQLKKNVHFTKEGYQVLAKQVADYIQRLLEVRDQPSGKQDAHEAH